jgi:nucleoside-diphosphate-sugar epimerase
MSDSRGTILVTGGTGLIGGEVIATLLDRGWSVKAVARASDDEAAAKRIHERLRKSRSRASHPEQLTCLAGSITEPGLGLRLSAFEGVSAILHAAGETAFNNDDSCWKTNVGAAENLVDLGTRLKSPPRVFFMSTASVCMSPTHSVIQEGAPFAGFENGYTRSKRHAERILAASGLDVVILRPTIVFSRGVNDRKMARSMLWVIPALIELGSAPVDAGSRIDIAPVDYVAHAVELVLRRQSFAHRLYHISSGQGSSATCGEIKDAIVRAYPRAGATRFSGGSKKRSSRVSPLRQRLEESISYYVPFMSADITYSNDRLARELGPELGVCPNVTEYLLSLLEQFEFQEGLEESARP